MTNMLFLMIFQCLWVFVPLCLACLRKATATFSISVTLSSQIFPFRKVTYPNATFPSLSFFHEAYCRSNLLMIKFTFIVSNSVVLLVKAPPVWCASKSKGYFISIWLWFNTKVIISFTLIGCFLRQQRETHLIWNKFMKLLVDLVQYSHIWAYFHRFCNTQYPVLLKLKSFNGPKSCQRSY